jgi:hypothetical protein
LRPASAGSRPEVPLRGGLRHRQGPLRHGELRVGVARSSDALGTDHGRLDIGEQPSCRSATRAAAADLASRLGDGSAIPEPEEAGQRQRERPAAPLSQMNPSEVQVRIPARHLETKICFGGGILASARSIRGVGSAQGLQRIGAQSLQ